MNTVNWLDFHNMLNLLSCISEDYLPNWDTTNNGLDLPHQSIIKECPTDLPTV